MIEIVKFLQDWIDSKSKEELKEWIAHFDGEDLMHLFARSLCPKEMELKKQYCEENMDCDGEGCLECWLDAFVDTEYEK